MTRRRCASVSTVVLLLVSAGPALAQVGTAPAGPPIEFTVGGSWSAPVGLGAVNADFFTSSGATFTQFAVENRLGQGFGLDVRLGVPIGQGRRLWIEGVGALARTSLQTEITSDVEDADGVTISERALRYSVGGAARWVIRRGAATEWFLRAGGGWLREVAAGSALADNGWSTDAGAGWTYLLRDRSQGGLRRLGLRIDGRLEIRSGGVAFGEDKLRIGPVAGGALMMGFR
jgi:hypothetical protein